MIKFFNDTKNIEKIILLVFTLLSIYLTFNLHNKIPEFHYRSEIWSDKVGYYIYLPATFIYDFKTANFPENIDHKTGDGFTLDVENDKVKTKYTCGVAILLTPVFLTTHLIANIFNLEPTGFSKIYHNAVNVGAIIYLILGLLFLHKFLKKYFNLYSSLIAVFIIFISTNLFWYSIVETLMSHIYSFSLFAAFLYFSKQFIDSEKNKFRYFIVLSILLSLIILIRPTNFILGFILLFIDIKNFTDFKNRIFSILKLKYIAIFIIIFTIVISPQLFYWKYLTGSFISYSYGEEGFIYWKNPKILEVLFNPGNSLFLFTPVWIIIIISMILFILKEKWLGISITSFFVFIVYLSASWHSWSFGCSYGMRSITEYLTIFSIPLTFLIEKILTSKKKFLKIFMFMIISYFSFFNLKITYNYDGCFYGELWDWKEYYNYIDRNKLFIFTTNHYTYNNDFEDINYKKFTKHRENIFEDSKFSHSGSNSSKVDSVSCGFYGRLALIGIRKIQKANIELYVYLPDSFINGQLYTCIEDWDTTFFEDTLNISGFEINKWNKIEHSVILPETPQVQYIFVYCRTKNKEFYIDDLKIKFEY